MNYMDYPPLKLAEWDKTFENIVFFVVLERPKSGRNLFAARILSIDNG